MQLSKLNEMVEDAFDLEEGYTRSDILKFTKMVAKKAANMFRKEHAAFVKKHKLNVNDGGVLGSSEADASWDDFLDLLLDELDGEGIDLNDSHEPGEVLTEASKEQKQLDKIEDHFEKLEKSAEFLFRMNKDLRDKSWDKAILALDQEIADLAMAVDNLED